MNLQSDETQLSESKSNVRRLICKKPSINNRRTQVRPVRRLLEPGKMAFSFNISNPVPSQADISVPVSINSNIDASSSTTSSSNENSIPTFTSDNLNTLTSTAANGFNWIKCTTQSQDFKFGTTNILDKHKTLSTHSNSEYSQLDGLRMECGSCDICFQDFSSDKCVPKMLGCGHSICTECLVILLDSKKSCPKCNKPMLKTSVGNYPTNFDLLSLSESIKKYACTDPHMICSLESLKKLLVIRRESLVKSIVDRTSLKNMVTNDITRIEQMTELDRDVLVRSEAESLIKEIRDNLEKVERVLNCCNPVVKQTYSLTQYKNPVQFLYDISIRLHKRELIYACEMVNGRLKYGKIEFDDDRISIHALTSSTVDKNASVVALQDLKKCLTLENFLVFIKLGKRTLLFKLMDSSIQALQFIKLCTGETGPVFQGSPVAIKAEYIEGVTVAPGADCGKNAFVPSSTPFQVASPVIAGNAQNFKISPGSDNTTNRSSMNVVTIEHYFSNYVKADGCIDYNISLFGDQTAKPVNEGDIVLQCFLQGKCRIFKCLQSSNVKNMIGVLESKELRCFEFQLLNATFVEDCGIAFRL